MAPDNADEVADELAAELRLMSRFTQAYRTKFAQMVCRLNGHEADAEQQGLLLCVEAMNMLLDSQDRVTRMLARMQLDEQQLLRRAA